MKKMVKMLAMILSAGLVAAVATMFSPRTAHALVAALVQVSNTAAAPAMTLDVSRLASQKRTARLRRNPKLFANSS